MKDPYQHFKTIVLDNGLTVYFLQMSDRPGTTCELIVHSGSKDDPKEHAGIAHFVEHLISENMPIPAKDLQLLCKHAGGSINFGETGWMYTSFGFRIPSDHKLLRHFFNTFGITLLHTSLTNGIEQERQVITQEYHRSFPTELHVLRRQLHQEALYKHSERREHAISGLGTLASIAAMPQQAMQRFYNRYYVPANMSIVVVSDLSEDDMLTHILASPFGNNKSGVLNVPKEQAATVNTLRQHSATLRFSDFLTETPSVCEYATFSKMPGTLSWQSCNVASLMLFERLFTRVREDKQWTYDTHVSWAHSQPYKEFAVTFPALNPVALEHIEGILADEISLLPQQEDLFELVCEGCCNAIPMRDESAAKICTTAANDVSDTRSIETRQQEYAGYEQLTIEDIATVASFLQPEYRFTRFIVP